MNALIWLAIVLFIIWILGEVRLRPRRSLFHILWIAAIVLLIIWLVRKFM